MKKKSGLVVAALVLLTVLARMMGVSPSDAQVPLTPTQTQGTGGQTTKPSGLNTASGAEVTLHFIDAGQGDATLITSEGHAVLIDASKKSEGDTVVNYLKDQGITTLDAVIATHPHEDHIGGMPAVFQAFDVKSVYMSDEAAETNIFEQFLDAIDDEGIAPQFPNIGDTIPLTDSAVFTVLAPGPNSAVTYGEDKNAWSIVTRLDGSGCSALFTGDTTTAVEQDMVRRAPELLRCDVLKVTHHGSRTGSSKAFIEAATPRYAVIPYEEGNSYGLPDEEVFERLEPFGTEIYETAKHGTIVMTLHNSEVTVE